MDYPDPGTAVVSIRGTVDDASLSRVDELMRHRLASLIDVLIVDMSAVAFVSVSGLELLHHVFARAYSRGMIARLVVTTHEVRRALQVSGLGEILECRPDVTAALMGPAGR